MSVLAILILVMMVVSRCSKELAKSLEETHSCEYIRAVGCLRDTSKYANISGLALETFRNALSSVMAGNPLYRETRDTERLLPLSTLRVQYESIVFYMYSLLIYYLFRKFTMISLSCARIHHGSMIIFAISLIVLQNIFEFIIGFANSL